MTIPNPFWVETPLLVKLVVISVCVTVDSFVAAVTTSHRPPLLHGHLPHNLFLGVWLSTE